MSCVLCKFKTICRTLQAWKVGQWKNGFRDNYKNSTICETIQVIAIVRKMPPDFMVILNRWYKISSSTRTSARSIPASNSPPKDCLHIKNQVLLDKIHAWMTKVMFQISNQIDSGYYFSLLLVLLTPCYIYSSRR